ncbi:UNVERIFIED_CONTAM: hypothetical protein K2H54_069320 [Gekko kuhli]
MSAAIAALASYGGSDSDSDSGPDAEGGAGHSAQVAAGDAVLHLASAPPAQQALLPAVDSAPAVAVKEPHSTPYWHSASMSVACETMPSPCNTIR